MQRWEYLFILLDGDNAYRPRWANGREIPEWGQLSADGYANELGQQGWELVATPYTASASGESRRLIFKRPVS